MEGRVDRDELQAAIEARRELGPELEGQVVDSFVERIERRITERAPKPVAAHRTRREGGLLVAAISLGVAIPLTAIAATHGGILAILIVWIGIVLVNAVYNR